MRAGAYWEAQTAPEMAAAVLAHWTDELEDWNPEQVRFAMRRWQREQPNKRPNPGHILGILKEERGRAVVSRARESQAQIPAPGRHHETREERRVSADRARAIMADVLGSIKAGAAE